MYSDDAVCIDGARGVHRGAVMVDCEEQFEVEGKSIEHEAGGVFDVGDNGRITRWRDYYDLRSLVECVVASASPPT